MSKGNEDLTPELHFKLCKKIAQLTKVVYHLHTKNEDHEAEIRELAIAYEQQIDEVFNSLFNTRCTGTQMPVFWTLNRRYQ